MFSVRNFTWFLYKLVFVCLFCQTKMLLEEYNKKIRHKRLSFFVLLVFAVIKFIKSNEWDFETDGNSRIQINAYQTCLEQNKSLPVLTERNNTVKFKKWLLDYSRPYQGFPLIFCVISFVHVIQHCSIIVHTSYL